MCKYNFSTEIFSALTQLDKDQHLKQINALELSIGTQQHSTRNCKYHRLTKQCRFCPESNAEHEGKLFSQCCLGLTKNARRKSQPTWLWHQNKIPVLLLDIVIVITNNYCSIQSRKISYICNHCHKPSKVSKPPLFFLVKTNLVWFVRHKLFVTYFPHIYSKDHIFYYLEKWTKSCFLSILSCVSHKTALAVISN